GSLAPALRLAARPFDRPPPGLTVIPGPGLQVGFVRHWSSPVFPAVVFGLLPARGAVVPTGFRVVYDVRQCRPPAARRLCDVWSLRPAFPSNLWSAARFRSSPLAIPWSVLPAWIVRRGNSPVVPAVAFAMLAALPATSLGSACSRPVQLPTC